MNIIVRFYWQHDLDLISLVMHPDFNMGKWMKRAIIAAARGDEGFFVPIPRSIPYRVELDSCAIHFKLMPGEEDDVIDYLHGFRYGFRNSAMKQIFRLFLERPYLEAYFNEETYAAKCRGVNPGQAKKDSRVFTNQKMSHSARQKAVVHPEPGQETPGKQSRIEKKIGSGMSPASSIPSMSEKEQVLPSSAKKTNMSEEEIDLSIEEEEAVPEDFDLFAAVDNMLK